MLLLLGLSWWLSCQKHLNSKVYPPHMSILVAAYSRDGHTSSVARAIAKELNADLDLIEDKRKRTEIAQSKDPLKYSLVIVGTPTWSYNLTPAIRTYLMDNPLGSEGRKTGK